jgi:uncharacterized protein with GYD domain
MPTRLTTDRLAFLHAYVDTVVAGHRRFVLVMASQGLASWVETGHLDSEVRMATYILLVNWTDQGIRNLRETVSHETAFEELVQKMGGQLREAFWTIGTYDSVGVFNAPDDETATAIALSYASRGNGRTTILRAFNRDEMTQIVQRTT